MAILVIAVRAERVAKELEGLAAGILNRGLFLAEGESPSWSSPAASAPEPLSQSLPGPAAWTVGGLNIQMETSVTLSPSC